MPCGGRIPRGERPARLRNSPEAGHPRRSGKRRAPARLAGWCGPCPISLIQAGIRCGGRRRRGRTPPVARVAVVGGGDGAGGGGRPPPGGEALARSLAEVVGDSALAFYDAIAPIVAGDSVDQSVAFRQSRYGKGGGDDYLNLPLSREEYERFVDELLAGQKVEPHAFEEPRYFEGCLPIEVMAARGREALAFGPMKPVGLVDPRTGRRPHAVVQLRREDRAGTAWNLVGFQTRLTWPEQKRIFSSCIPGLRAAEWIRLGQVHRNTFLDAPRALAPDGSLRARPHVFCAGQIPGVDGYVESAASGHSATSRRV